MNEGLKKRIRDLLRREYELAAKSSSQKSLLKKIKKELMAEGWKENFRGALITLTRQAEKALGAELAHQKTAGKPELKAAAEIIENMSEQYDYIFSKILRKVEKALSNAIDSGNVNWQDAARAALKPLLEYDHYIETELQTGQAALDRAIRINNLRESAKDGETILLRYEGPIPERAFCQRHYNKVYSLEEVEKMINDMGQPALYYCGGYNCRHRWVQQRS